MGRGAPGRTEKKRLVILGLQILPPHHPRERSVQSGDTECRHSRPGARRHRQHGSIVATPTKSDAMIVLTVLTVPIVVTAGIAGSILWSASVPGGQCRSCRDPVVP